MESNNILICPVCGEPLSQTERTFSCVGGHSFDIAKEGYVNLLCGKHKNGSLIGDNKSMAALRHSFLEKGYFSSLADGLITQIKKAGKTAPVMLDICCGEGYYSQQVFEKVGGTLYGFDISKSMVKLAAKRKTDGIFFVAGLSHIPIKSESVDIAFHLFAPFHESEFSRILKNDGILITVIPGENHLFSLKKAVYEKPYKNDERMPEVKSLKPVDKIKISAEITLKNQPDIQSLFGMTPYFYRTSPSDKAKLEKTERLKTEIEFIIGIYSKGKAQS